MFSWYVQSNRTKYLRSRLRRAISLPTILEPIRHLSQRQAGFLREIFLLIRRGISISHVAFLQGVSRSFFEAIDGFFAVPNRLRQRILFAQSIFVDGAQRSTANFLGFAIMWLEPHLLEFRMTTWRKGMTFQNWVEFVVGSAMKGNSGTCHQNAFASTQQFSRRQRPKKSNINIELFFNIARGNIIS